MGVNLTWYWSYTQSVLRIVTMRNFVQTCRGAPGSDSSRKKMTRKRNGSFFVLPTVSAGLLLTSLKACDWSEHIFGACASLSSWTKKTLLFLISIGMSLSSPFHRDQFDTCMNYAYSRCVRSSFVRSWCWLICFFLLFLPFFDFDLDIVCFMLSFSCGYYAVSSVSVSAATRLAYDTYLDKNVRLSHFCIFVWGTRFVSVIVCTIFSFSFCFSPAAIVRSRVNGACPLTMDCIVAMR